MLPPNRRELYLSALRPPSGFQLDRAIGTTYSLDLMTMLSLPLSFALLDLTDPDGRLRRDPVALLHALRAYANRLTIFCQAGGIAVPAQRHPLYAHLEEAIVPVRKKGGTFHPKIWALRFTSPGEPVRYRFLCLSRNITGDPSWDTLLALDGEVVERQRAFAKNHPLAEFLVALPGLATDQLHERHGQAVKLLADELRRVRFELPEPFDDYEFCPMGLPGFRVPDLPEGTRRLLVVSPFVTASFLKDLAEEAPAILISREESLDALDAATLAKFQQVFAIEDSASGNDEATETPETPAPSLNPSDEAAAQTAPQGLHAKLYLADAGWDSDLWTGSANATSAGFHHNVEFLTRLTGKKSKIGIDVFLNGVSGSKGFSQFLLPYQIPKSPPVVNEVAEQNAKLAEELRTLIVALPLRFEVAREEKLYRLALRTLAPPSAQINATAIAWPVTLPQSAAQPMAPLFSSNDLVFDNLSSQGLTAFLAVIVTAGRGENAVELRFVLKLPLVGVPEDRFENLLHHVLSDQANVLRYLLFLIHHDGLQSGRITDLVTPVLDPAKRRGANSVASIPLLEELSRALATQPELLDGVQSLVADLRKTVEGAALLPRNFDSVWAPIWRAREALRR
ncbi:MAG: hypothetical protein E6G97_21950 [Alphaproteobacteria bacterium]|nr:MAG: hypothetical protein E6G97_21950 [Alphaproteobacteria bacterium]